MSELLSSEEIDTLLTLFRGEGGNSEVVEGAIAVHAGDAGPLEVEAIDLLAPTRIGHGALGFIDRLLRDTARSLGAELAQRLERSLECECTAVEAIRWASWRSEFQHPSLLFEIELAPLRHSACIEVRSAFVQQVVDAALGGDGSFSTSRPGFTAAEVAVVEGLMKPVADRLATSLSCLTPLTARVVGSAEDPSLLRRLPLPDEFVLSAQLSLGGLSDEHPIRVALPHEELDPLLLRGMRASANIRAAGAGRMRSTIEPLARTLSIPVRGELASLRASLADVLALRVGDVIRLPRRPNDSVDLVVGESKRVSGILGTIDGHRAVRIRANPSENPNDQVGDRHES
jgi:flagellar motor switch protein FliM